MSFEFGWKAGQDILDRARQRRTDKRQKKNDKASRRANNAAAAVNRQEARRRKNEEDARERDGYYEAAPTLTQEQQDQVDAVPDLASDFKKEKGPLQGMFQKKEKSAIKEGAAKARQAKQEAKKLAQENQHTKKIRSGLGEEGYEQLSEDYLTKSAAEAKQKEADANLALAKANDYNKNADQDRAIKQKEADASLKQAEANLKIAAFNLNKAEEGAKSADTAIKHREAFESAATAFNEIMVAGPTDGESFPDFRGRLITELDRITAYTGGNAAAQGYIAKRREELSAGFKEHFARLQNSEAGKAKLKYDDMVAVAKISIDAKGYGEELKQIEATQGQSGVDGMITRFFIEEDARKNGVSHLIDPDNVEFQRALKFKEHPTKPYRTHIVEGREEPLFNKDTGEPIKNMVLDMGPTLSAWENLKKYTLARYGPSQVQVTFGDRPVSQSGGVTFANEPTGRQTEEYSETRIISPSGLNLTDVPKTKWEMFDPATAQETFNFLNGWKLGNPFLAPAPSQSPRPEQPTRSGMIGPDNNAMLEGDPNFPKLPRPEPAPPEQVNEKGKPAENIIQPVAPINQMDTKSTRTPEGVPPLSVTPSNDPLPDESANELKIMQDNGVNWDGKEPPIDAIMRRYEELNKQMERSAYPEYDEIQKKRASLNTLITKHYLHTKGQGPALNPSKGKKNKSK